MTTPLDSWPSLGRLVRLADEVGAIQVWLFGSAQTSPSPRDLDVLVIYADEQVPGKLRSSTVFELLDPPIDLIALMPDEAEELSFLATVPATLLFSTLDGDCCSVNTAIAK